MDGMNVNSVIKSSQKFIVRPIFVGPCPLPNLDAEEEDDDDDDEMTMKQIRNVCARPQLFCHLQCTVCGWPLDLHIYRSEFISQLVRCPQSHTRLIKLPTRWPKMRGHIVVLLTSSTSLCDFLVLTENIKKLINK